ncbi:hypothetical protein [Sphingobium sp. WCS2017Hpa-17]|uniref:DUF7302 family protein n=1 Tax=Sphingobium sp. WCS2017Hpa-17 TaxID=3073638 RepID=UPI00288A7ACC|nr:hypothetical protein [Sphingobium sp. WCS2017Hpa-17]
MKIKALSTFRGDEGMIRRGSEVTVSDVYGRDLIKRGRAVEVADDADEASPKPAPKPTTKPKGAQPPREGE